MAKSYQVKLKSKVGDAPAGYVVQLTVNAGAPNGAEVKAALIKAGFKIRDDDTDAMIVDRWFQTVCRNIALELYEQQQADPENRAMASDMRVVKAKDLGNGRTEVS